MGHKVALQLGLDAFVPFGGLGSGVALVWGVASVH